MGVPLIIFQKIGGTPLSPFFSAEADRGANGKNVSIYVVYYIGGVLYISD